MEELIHTLREFRSALMALRERIEDPGVLEEVNETIDYLQATIDRLQIAACDY